MPDDSISPGAANDSLSYNAELPIPIDTLTIGGENPDVGDPVRFRVGGTVKRVVNETVYVSIDTVNDVPLQAPIVEPNDGVAEEDRLRQLSQTVDRDSLI